MRCGCVGGWPVGGLVEVVVQIIVEPVVGDMHAIGGSIAGVHGQGDQDSQNSDAHEGRAQGDTGLPVQKGLNILRPRPIEVGLSGDGHGHHEVSDHNDGDGCGPQQDEGKVGGTGGG